MSDHYNKGFKAGMRHMQNRMKALTTERDLYKKALKDTIRLHIICDQCTVFFHDNCKGGHSSDDECIELHLEQARGN